jgi:REP element-mobilizing transposase RayT
MPRGARLDAPGTLHHVIVRGIEQGSIVRDDTDRQEFLDRMGLLAKGSGTSICAFALMTNQANILLKSGPDGLSSFMRRLLSGYAPYFNRRHDRGGHLFQNRYKSIVCEEEGYFDKLVAYIHLTPLRAGLVESLEQLASYPWCGHAVLLNRVRYDWMDRNYVLRFFGGRAGAAREAYLAFLEEELGIDREQELMGGGLVRSLGGWAHVHALLQRSGAKALGDERILGGIDFVRELLKGAEMLNDGLLPKEELQQKLCEAVEQACEAAGVSATFLRSGSRSGKLPSLRKQLAKKGAFEIGLPLAEIARQLGVTPSAVSAMLKRQ